MKILPAILAVFSAATTYASPYAANSPFQPNPSTTVAPLVSRQESPITQQAETRGSIVSVDTVFGHITLRDDQGNIADFQVHSNVPVLQQGVQLKLADLKPGDHVLIRFTARTALVQLIQKL